MKFTELNLTESVQQGIDDAGFVDCTEVQERTFSATLSGRDVLVQSQTGTGKTAAFLISIYQLMTTDPKFQGKRALIIAPTRELAVQIEKEAQLLGRHLPFGVGCFYGGVGYADQERKIAENVEIIVGTPGRLIDFAKSGKLDFRAVGILVIDEADRLFDMGFYPDIQWMLRRMLPKEERMTMLYSATLSTRARNIAWQHMDSPAEIEVEPEHLTVKTIDQTLYHVSREEKMKVLLGILKKKNPENALIFTNMKRTAEEIAKRLQLNGYACKFIIGDLPQKKRQNIIDSIKNGSLKFLVATDVAARGLHVDDLEMVVNYDIPEDPEAYVHRIGRTARAGKSGLAVALACERYVLGLEAIESLIGQKIPVEPVTDDLLHADESAGRPLHIVRTPRPGDGPRDHRSGGGRSDRGGRRPRSAQHGGNAHSREGAETRRVPGRVPEPPVKAKHSTDGAPGDPHAPLPSARRRRNRGQKPTGSPRPEGAGKPVRAGVDERLEYYREKYGEDFRVPDSDSGNSSAAKPQDKKPQSKKAQSPKSQSSTPPTKPRSPGSPADRGAPVDAETAGKGVVSRIKGLFSKKKK
ncbi:MAG: DEAD/DEAH box helicase [Spirochaetaceae bacterium]|nr:MAG: DEAD/DEAH box helicase [Spirochaetaceae bacterium]